MCGRGSDSVNHLGTCWKPQQEFPEPRSVPHTAPSFCLSWATRLDYRSTITFHLQTSSYLNMVSLCTTTSPYTGMHTIFAWGTAAISKVFQKDSVSRVSWVFGPTVANLGYLSHSCLQEDIFISASAVVFFIPV